MLKSGSTELSSAGGNSTPLSPEAKSHTETDATWERGLGVCCVTKGRSVCLSGPQLLHPVKTSSANAGHFCWGHLSPQFWLGRPQEVALLI